MIEVKKERIRNGHDCWGRAEYEDFYVVVDENNNTIYKSKDDPTKLIEYFQNKYGWIPCSERLPEYDVNVLVQCKDGSIEIGRYSKFVYIFEICQWVIDSRQFYKEYVKAWQPLPEPYEELTF